MKRFNPHTPIMIREALDIGPRVYARYEFGREKMADLRGTRGQKRMLPASRNAVWVCVDSGLTVLSTGLDDKAIEEKVTRLVKDAAQ